MKAACTLPLIAMASCLLIVPLFAQEEATAQKPPGETLEVDPNVDETVEDVIATQPGPSDTPETEDQKAGDPCALAYSVKEAWIDRLQLQVQQTVCGSAVWFDHFFGQGEAVNREEFYGYVGLGLLYKTAGDWDDQSRFDANIPLPNLSKRLNLFIGRGDEDDFISDRSSSVSEPVAAFDQSAGDSWLAGFGYTPEGPRGKRLDLRLGAKVGSQPYVFGQARWRFNYYPTATHAIRLRQTFFYRTNDDGLGSTSAIAYDWFLRKDLMGRASGSATLSQGTEGIDWKAFLTVYQDLSGRWGKARGAAYQYFIRGETEYAVTVPEYGVRVTYRQQMFREYLFGEAILGYSWDKDDRAGEILKPERVESWNLGFVVELQFGSKWRAGRAP